MKQSPLWLLSLSICPTLIPSILLQIFLSEKVDNGYRLLARVGVEVQEVLVTTELERDIMKQVVRDATVSNSSERRLALADFAS